MRILLSAAEASADVHGAAVLRALERKATECGQRVEAFGIGGPALRSAGLRTVVDARELLSMGTTEVLGKLPRILRALSATVDAARAERPDIAVVIDYPDFHFRLASRLKALNVPVVYYIAPKVWVWRKGRVERLKADFRRVLGILPFEASFYRDHGVDYRYVGNPLLDELPVERSRGEARTKLGLKPDEPVLVAMPGSRPAELRAHLELMLEAALQVASGLRKSGKLRADSPLTLLIPLPMTAESSEVARQVADWIAGGPDRMGLLSPRVSVGDAHWAQLAADAGMIKSGTSTLEAALLGCPHVVVYRPSWLTGFIFKNLISYRGPVGLVNLVSGGPVRQERPLLPELLCENATAERISGEVLSLLLDESRRTEAMKGLEGLRRSLEAEGGSPIERAAEEIWKAYEERGQ